MFEVLENLYVNDYNAFTSIMPRLLGDFPSIQKDANPFLSMAERAHISHGYAQHEGKKDKTATGDLGGIVHGLAVPISYQQAHPLWTNIPSGHATGNLTIKVRHLPQSEHLAVGSLPGTYNLASWSVETGENEKEMNKKAVEEGGGIQEELINMIEAQGDIPAWLRKSPYTGASHIYFSQPPYTTELDRKKGYPLYDKVYTEKTKIRKNNKGIYPKVNRSG